MAKEKNQQDATAMAGSNGEAGEKAGDKGGGKSGDKASAPASRAAGKALNGAAQAEGAAPRNKEAAGAGKDAIALLKEDHRKVEGLFRQYEEAGEDSDANRRLVRQIASEFLTHSRIEEEIFYPACRDKVEDDLLDEAQVEHDGAKLLLMELRNGSPDEPYYDAKVAVLSEYIKHHVGEEEKGGEGIFDAAREAGVDVVALGKEISQRKEEIARRVETEMTPPMPSLVNGKGAIGKESKMAQQDYMERSRTSSRYDDDDDDRRGGRGGGRRTPPRDEEGRFMSEDRGSRSSSSRDRDYDDDRDRDSRGRFRSSSDDRDRDRDRGDDRRGWYGDREGHSEASRRGWDERGRASASRRDDDDDYRGRSSRSSRRDDDDDDRGRGRGQGGWFGDSRGHSEASRRGWDNPDHGPSGWYGDSRGHSEASRRGWDNPDHGPSGWYGDPEGHSEASRRGWEERGRGNGGRRDDDDDYGRGRSSSTRARGRDDDDDDRGRSSTRSRSRDDDDDDDRGRGRGQGQGHGGWFGDSRGHSEAARRGWQNR